MQAVPWGFAMASFTAPATTAHFDMSGKKIKVAGKENPSPREMDELEFDVDDNGNILVKFVDFYTGIHEKKPKL